jgi:hypothetical protein
MTFLFIIMVILAFFGVLDGVLRAAVYVRDAFREANRVIAEASPSVTVLDTYRSGSNVRRIHDPRISRQAQR